MKKIIKFELSKQLMRKENFILLSMLLIPLLYSLGISNNSSNITYNSKELVTGLSFAKDMYVFVYMIFIFYLVLAINSSNILRQEMDNGSISMMLTRINNRKKIYKGKLYAQIIYRFLLNIIFLIFCIICFYLFVSKLSISSGKLFDDKYISNILTIIALFSSFILAISMVQAISMYFKPYTSIGIFLLIWVILMFIKEFEAIRFLSPLFYLEKIIEESNLQFEFFIKFMIINWLMVYIFEVSGNMKFKKSDIS